MRIIGEFLLISSIIVHHVDFIVFMLPIRIRLEDNPFTPSQGNMRELCHKNHCQ